MVATFGLVTCRSHPVAARTIRGTRPPSRRHPGPCVILPHRGRRVIARMKSECAGSDVSAGCRHRCGSNGCPLGQYSLRCTGFAKPSINFTFSSRADTCRATNVLSNKALRHWHAACLTTDAQLIDDARHARESGMELKRLTRPTAALGYNVRSNRRAFR